MNYADVMPLPDLEAWAIFARVAEHGSFSAAAKSIGLSKATVSKAIARLEASLGQSLFNRTSRRLALTACGATLAERARSFVAEAEATEEAARDAAVALAGTIRVAAPMSFGLAHLSSAIAEFLNAHPGVTIELDLSDAVVDIVAEGFDVALRIARLPDSSLRARRLCAIPLHTVAAPDYLAQHGTPTHPSELASHACFTYTNASPVWRFWRNGAEVSVKAAGPLAVNSGEATLPALRAGLGITVLPDFIVEADLAAGTLVPILTDWGFPPLALHLVTPPSPLRPARVEALIAFLAERFRAHGVTPPA